MKADNKLRFQKSISINTVLKWLQKDSVGALISINAFLELSGQVCVCIVYDAAKLFIFEVRNFKKHYKIFNWLASKCALHSYLTAYTSDAADRLTGRSNLLMQIEPVQCPLYLTQFLKYKYFPLWGIRIVIQNLQDCLLSYSLGRTKIKNIQFYPKLYRVIQRSSYYLKKSLETWYRAGKLINFISDPSLFMWLYFCERIWYIFVRFTTHCGAEGNIEWQWHIS